MEAVFAYLDEQQLGFITRKRVVEVLSRPNFKQKSDFKDNFEWQEQIIRKIQQHLTRHQLSPATLFHRINTTCCGLITPDELVAFLKDTLLVSADELQPVRVSRLLKVFDTQKNNSSTVSLADFIRVLQGVQLASDWQHNCLRQMGQFVLRHYGEPTAAFEDLSLLNQRVTKSRFLQWIKEGLILNGLHLSLDMEHQLFAKFDKHRKGYLV